MSKNPVLGGRAFRSGFPPALPWLSGSSAAQPPVLPDHGHVADAPVGHQRHHRADVIGAGAGEDLPGHHAPNAFAQHADAAIGDGVEDVAL
jgi:hypothetical protein